MLEDFVVAIKDVAESVRFAFVHGGEERGGNNSGGGAADADDGGGGDGGGGDVEYDTWYDGDNDEDVKRVSPLGCGAVDGIHISVESVEFISHDSNSTSKSGSRSGSSSGNGSSSSSSGIGSGSGSMGLASRIVGGGGSLRSSPGRAHSEIILVRLRVGWRVWQHLPSSLRRSLRETRTRSKLTTQGPQDPQGPRGTGDTGMHAGDSGMHTGDTTYATDATDATGATAGSVSTSAGTRGWVTPFPVLITQGINEMQSIANALGANKLQEAVNQKGVVRLATYANAVRKSVY